MEHRHSYVRKNPIFAVYTIYREFENLVSNAPEIMQTFLAAATCKRNAFMFSAHCAIPKAVEWILSVYEQVSGLVELLQMSAIVVI
jgi:coatomer subunit beta